MIFKERFIEINLFTDFDPKVVNDFLVFFFDIGKVSADKPIEDLIESADGDRLSSDMEANEGRQSQLCTLNQRFWRVN